MQILLQTQILHILFRASQCELHSNLKASCLLRPFPPLHCIAVSKSDCTRLFSVSFPFHSLTSRLLTPNTWLVEIVIRHFFCFWSVALCAVILHELLHVLTAEISTHFRPGMEAATTWSWKRRSRFDSLHRTLWLGAVLYCPHGGAVCAPCRQWAVTGQGHTSPWKMHQCAKTQWLRRIFGAATIHGAGEGVLRACDKN